MNTNNEAKKPSVIIWNPNALNKSRSFESALSDKQTQNVESDIKPEDAKTSSPVSASGDLEGKTDDNQGLQDWRLRKMRLQKQLPVPKLHIELESDEGFLESSCEVVEDRNSLSPVLPHHYDKARSCSTSSCSTDSTDLGSSELQQDVSEAKGDNKDIFFKKKLRARYLSSQSSEDSEAEVQKYAMNLSVPQREEFKLRSKSADYETPTKERPVLQRQTHSLSTIEESSRRETNLLQWWTHHGSIAAERQFLDRINIKQEVYSPHHSPMNLTRRHSMESLSDAPDVFSPLTPQSFALPLHFEGEGGYFRFPGDGGKIPQPRQFTPPRSPRSPRYIPDSRLQCLSEQPQPPNFSMSKNSLAVPSPTSPSRSPGNMKEYHSPNIFTFSPLVIPPGEGSLKTLPRTPTSGFPLGLDNPSTHHPKYLFSPQLYNDLAEAQRQRLNNGNTKNDNTFICPICGQIFSSFDNLAKHMAKHLPTETVRSGNNNKIHYCKVCNRAFARSDMLTRHMRLHTGLKPYECHVCGQVFSRSDHLNTHQRTHTGEKPYKCPQCPYAACRRDMITRHMRIHSKQWPRRGALKGSALKDDIRKCSLSSADSMESAETGRGNMSISSVDSLDVEKESRKSSYGSSDSFESDISGRSISGESSMDLGNARPWARDSLECERSPKKVQRVKQSDVVDNKRNMYLQIPGRSVSSSTGDSEEVPSPRPQIWTSGGSLDEQLFLGESRSPLSLSQRAYSDEGHRVSTSSFDSTGSPTPRAVDNEDKTFHLSPGDLGSSQDAFSQHRTNRTISLESEASEGGLGIREYNIRRFGLKKQRNFSSTSFDSVDSIGFETGSLQSESSMSLDETAFLKCIVSNKNADPLQDRTDNKQTS